MAAVGDVVADGDVAAVGAALAAGGAVAGAVPGAGVVLAGVREADGLPVALQAAPDRASARPASRRGREVRVTPRR